MNASGPGGSNANAEFSRELRITASHERCRFLMPGLDKPDFVLSFAQRFHDAVDAVAGDTEHRVDTPIDQIVYHNFSCCLCHSASPKLRQRRGPNVTRNFVSSLQSATLLVHIRLPSGAFVVLKTVSATTCM